MSIRGRIVRQFPCLGKLVRLSGYDFKNCILCGAEGRPQDMDRFTHCANYGCNTVYCNECYEELNNLCTVCMNPVDYGDLSDASEEVRFGIVLGPKGDAIECAGVAGTCLMPARR